MTEAQAIELCTYADDARLTEEQRQWITQHTHHLGEHDAARAISRLRSRYPRSPGSRSVRLEHGEPLAHAAVDSRGWCVVCGVRVPGADVE